MQVGGGQGGSQPVQETQVREKVGQAGQGKGIAKLLVSLHMRVEGHGGKQAGKYLTGRYVRRREENGMVSDRGTAGGSICSKPSTLCFFACCLRSTHTYEVETPSSHPLASLRLPRNTYSSMPNIAHRWSGAQPTQQHHPTVSPIVSLAGATTAPRKGASPNNRPQNPRTDIFIAPHTYVQQHCCTRLNAGCAGHLLRKTAGSHASVSHRKPKTGSVACLARGASAWWGGGSY